METREYFFIAVSTRRNLEICKEYRCAGFPDTINGAWAYSDIKVGDYVTFLYGARAHNLYEVVEKEAVRNPQNLPPPWEPVRFRESGRVSYFPFRLRLRLLREFDESLARQEFMYISENLLQRGGYWKTHFQADFVTLHNVSRLGRKSDGDTCAFEMPPHETFVPKFARIRKSIPPEVYQLREVIVQSIIRQHLLHGENLRDFLENLGLGDLSSRKFEVLGEKALPEGYVDILIKDAEPVGETKQIIVEVKMGRAARKDVEQLERYMKELGEECVAGVLIAERAPKVGKDRIHTMRYEFEGMDLRTPHTFDELLSSIRIRKV